MGKYIVCNDELYHHGVKGMKWGMRKKITPNRKKHMVRKSAKATTDDKNVTRKALQRFIGYGNEWVANHHALYAAMEANRIATNAGLMNMSLGASMGTNPFMFGTM